MIPLTDYERLALLEEIEQGIKVVLPVSIEHAEFMIMVSQAYIKQQHEQTINVLKANYDRTN
jgi:hypothetical protein